MWCLLIVFLSAQQQDQTFEGFYAHDEVALAGANLARVENELGKLSDKQKAIVVAESAKIAIRIQFAEGGLFKYFVRLSEEDLREGLGRWRREGNQVTIVLTHKYGLRMENQRKIVGQIAGNEIRMILADDLPELILRKQPDKADAKP